MDNFKAEKLKPRMKSIIKKYFHFFSFFYSFVRNRFFVMLFLSVVVGLLDGIGLALFMPLLEVINQPEATNTENMGNLAFVIEFLNNLGLRLTLNVLLMALLSVYLIKGIIAFIESYYQVLLRRLFIRKLRFVLIDGLANMRYQSFVKTDAGSIQNSLSGEAGKVVQAFIAYTGTFKALLILLVYLSMAFLANAQFAIFVAIGGLITNFLYKRIYKLNKKLSLKVVAVGHRFQGLLIQSVQYYKYLKATAQFKIYASRLKNFVNELENLQRRMGLLNSIITATREPLVMMVVVVVILIQVNVLGGNLASILMSLLFFYRALNALMGVQSSWNSFLNFSGSIENARSFIKELNDKKEKAISRELSGFGNTLMFKDVSFQYSEDVKTLAGIDLTIQKNETIALVGESGSGKTTLVNMIAGLLNDYQGQIFIDSQPYGDFNPKSIQSKIGYITQEPVIFSDTLYNNITFWAPKTKENKAKFKEVIKKAALEEFVQDLASKEDTNLGDNGIQISGGQKQRVSIARELFKEVELLLLDEATSALDSKTESIIQKNIESLKGKFTMVMVAHRLSTIKHADRIVVLEKGKIEAIGSFSDLLLTNDRFRKMVELQEF